MHKCLTELIGTFFLVLTIGLATDPISGAKAFAPLAIGASLMVMVYMGGHVSGAHYNPAVSLAAFCRGKLEVSDFLVYVVVQVLGAMLAALAVFAATPDSRTFVPSPGHGLKNEILQPLLVEVIYTFALALVVLNVATAKKTAGNSFYGLAIGFTVAAAAFAGGGISGGAYNPAVGVGPAATRAILETIFKQETLTDCSHIWIYVVGPFVGGAAAAGVFLFQESGSSGE